MARTDMQQLRSDISNIARADADIVTKSCDGRHKIVRRSSQPLAQFAACSLTLLVDYFKPYF